MTPEIDPRPGGEDTRPGGIEPRPEVGSGVDNEPRPDGTGVDSGPRADGTGVESAGLLPVAPLARPGAWLARSAISFSD
ncbi:MULTISPECIES: hypothetical protein [Sorangium]|uniref:hypothetical protein n=1 Tax=Sorangium TaxID=39643 RepID=UPI00101A864A|nr:MULTISPECIES: hypothetical protein [Sorangium]